VDKVERGVRRLDKFSVVYEIADVLQLDVALLMGKDPERREGSVNCIDYRYTDTRADEKLMEGEKRSHLCL